MSFNALLAGGVCSIPTEGMSDVQKFQCPLSGRGLQLLILLTANNLISFQCPLSGRGLQQSWPTKSKRRWSFNALLAGGVCSLGHQPHAWRWLQFQCPLSGRGLQLMSAAEKRVEMDVSMPS